MGFITILTSISPFLPPSLRPSPLLPLLPPLLSHSPLPPSLPSSLPPFLPPSLLLLIVTWLYREASVQSHAKTTDPISTMAFLRKEKDTFRKPLLWCWMLCVCLVYLCVYLCVVFLLRELGLCMVGKSTHSLFLLLTDRHVCMCFLMCLTFEIVIIFIIIIIHVIVMISKSKVISL